MSTKPHKVEAAEVPRMFHANSVSGEQAAPQPSPGYPQNDAQAVLDRRLAVLEQHIAQLYARLDQSTPALLRVDLDGLGTALDSLSQQNRREFARIWRRLGHDEAAGGGPPDESPPPDPAFQAMLELQRK